MVKRGVIVACIKPGCEEQVAKVFAESDASELPKLMGVRHRSLFVLKDIYIHYVEMEENFDSTVGFHRDHPLFKDISKKLEPFIRAYDRWWESPKDATAQEFYHWDAPT